MHVSSSLRCSIVIRSYNEERCIGRLLHGIAQQTVGNVETIVVDSGSTDATRTIARRYSAKILSVRPEDFSFGYSLNIGCREAAADIIVIASAHVYPVYRDWLERLLVPFEDAKTALVYGKQQGGNATKFSEGQVFARWFRGTSASNQSTPFCNNANAAIRREVWLQLPYNENLTGLEDIDWARRAMQLGYRIAYEADAVVVHVHNETPVQTCNRYRREAIALKTIYPEEVFRFSDFLRLFLQNVLSDLNQAWREGVLRGELVGILSFRLMQFWGTYRGFAQRGPVRTELKRTFYYPLRKSPEKLTVQPSPTDRLLVDYQSSEPLYRGYS
jgi:rhamnosyltransferase